jgi:prolyl-tRNA synthetase
VYLPVGQRVLDKVNAIIREEMNRIGGQEITMPVLHPAEIWQQSGRWDGIPEMFKLRDRHGRDMCLGMTHEEVVAWLAAREIRSYRDLPQIWYQIQTKERDEARPRSGVLRTREFAMKDSYTLDPDLAALDRSYAAHEQAYRRIFDRAGLTVYVVQSDTGMMGGLGSHEFMAPSAPARTTWRCAACDHAANGAGPGRRSLRRRLTSQSSHDAGVPAIAGSQPARRARRGDDPLRIHRAGRPGSIALVRSDHSLHGRKLARARGRGRGPRGPTRSGRRSGDAGSLGPRLGHQRRHIDESLRRATWSAPTGTFTPRGRGGGAGLPVRPSICRPRSRGGCPAAPRRLPSSG